MKNYTDLEQSKRLAEILPQESADIILILEKNSELASHPIIRNYSEFYNYLRKFEFEEEHIKRMYIPAWSLAALLSVLPFPMLYMEMLGGAVLWGCECHFMESNKVIKTEHCKNPIDACYNLIINIHKQNIL